MAISLGQNIDSLTAQSELNKSTSSLTQSYQRLSSGLRINQASDDAAGLSIASQLNSNSRVYTQAARNINDGLSAANIAEGALNALKQISERQLELAEEAANGTYSSTQRQALNTEASALASEYNRIVNTTTFNGMNLLNPSLGTIIIQAGYGQTNGTLQLGLSNQLAWTTGTGTLQAAVTYKTGTSSTFVGGVAVGDFNNDGNEDLVTSIYGSPNTTSVLLGNGNGTFKAAATLGGANNGGEAVAVGDLTGNGDLDIVTADYPNNKVSVFLGNGNGTFRAGTSINDSGEPGSIALGDFDDNGVLDIVTAGLNGSQINILNGTGSGSFSAAQQVSGALGEDVTVATLNGQADLIVSGSGSLQVLLGNGNGTFQAATTYADSDTPVSFADLNGDGNLDMIASNSSGNVLVYFGNGNGTFQSAQTFATGGGGDSQITTGDVNGDGVADIITGDEYGTTVRVLLNNGNGTFQAPTSYQVTGRITSLVSGDLNNNGLSDVVTNTANNSVAVLMANTESTADEPNLNISTAQGALNAIDTVNTNLNRIEAQLGVIGATTSRFAVAVANLQTENENVQAAAGRIEDTDVAQESANLTRTQILQQAAASVLAQANQEPHLALVLLGTG